MRAPCRHRGYCPQFGGLIPRGASLKEHLKIFGRLKGVPESEMERHCERVITEFGLQDHKSKVTSRPHTPPAELARRLL